MNNQQDTAPHNPNPAAPPRFEQATLPPLQQDTWYSRNKILLKAAIVTLLALLLGIPQLMVNEMVVERRERQNGAQEEIIATWSDSQRIVAPIIAIPYRKLITDDDAQTKDYYRREYAYLMPEKVQINTEVFPSSKRIGLFAASIFTCNINIDGTFNNKAWQKLNIADSDVYWNDAAVLVGINDYKGLLENANLVWDGTTYSADADYEDKSLLSKSLVARVPLSRASLDAQHTFSCKLSIKGSRQLTFVPVGNQTDVALHTIWATPRFMGSYAAAYNPDFASKPLDAKWHIMGINRSFAQAFTNEQPAFEKESFGISFVPPLDTYGKTLRAVKYGMLVIFLTMLVYLFIELLQKKSAHPVQYGLVGLSLVVFYLLLLSISEHTGFNIAYLISAVATVGLIGAYTHAIFKNTKTTIAFTGFLGLLYSFICLLILLQDSALLVGSIGLFVIIGALMFGSKKVKWY